MNAFYFWAVVLFWLVFGAWDAYHTAKAREAMDAQLERDALKEASLTEVFADEQGVCHVCHEPAPVLELVELYDAFTLTCVACTHQIKARRGRQGVG